MPPFLVYRWIGWKAGCKHGAILPLLIENDLLCGVICIVFRRRYQRKGLDALSSIIHFQVLQFRALVDASPIRPPIGWRVAPRFQSSCSSDVVSISRVLHDTKRLRFPRAHPNDTPLHRSGGSKRCYFSPMPTLGGPLVLDSSSARLPILGGALGCFWLGSPLAPSLSCHAARVAPTSSHWAWTDGANDVARSSGMELERWCCEGLVWDRPRVCV